MSITLEGQVYMKLSYSGTPSYDWWSGPAISSVDVCGIHVGPCNFEYTIPDTFNPIATETEQLAAEKQKLVEKFTKAVAKINERLSKLQAIGNEVTS